MSLMTRPRSFGRTRQLGMAGILISSVLSAALILSAAQGTNKSNMKAYHAGNKSSIEEANQLMVSGLRYTSGILNNKPMLEAFFKTYKNDPKVIKTCSVTEPIPPTLVPTEVVENLWTPDASTQEVRIKAKFAPYDCDKNIGAQNFQVAFEVTGGSGCSGTTDMNAELCATRSVVMTAYNGEKYNPVSTPPPPPPPPVVVVVTPPPVVVVTPAPEVKKEEKKETTTTTVKKEETKEEKKETTSETTTTSKVSIKKKNVGL